MGAQRIRVSSRALGPRLMVSVVVYDTVQELRAAASAYNPLADFEGAGGVCQARTDEEGRAATVLVRLCRQHLGTEVIVHEMHHASTALYGSQVADRITRRVHLTHHNEGFAYLHSDLTRRLVDRLYALGYYD